MKEIQLQELLAVKKAADELSEISDTFIRKYMPEKTLPTVEELNFEWAKESRSINGVNPRVSVNHDYIMACWESRFIANRIRKAERKMGRYFVVDKPLDEATAGHAVWCDNNRNGYVTFGGMSFGTEYFATKAGAELYKEAMGDDLKHLLCK